jgi:ribosome-binding factor A
MSIRTERVAKLIQQEVADLLQKDFHEGSQSLLTVTGARMTSDLTIAYVDVSVLGDRPEQRQAAFKRLEALTPEIRRALAGRIRHQFKRMPELRFFLDETPQHAAHMDEIFARIRAERGDRPDAAEEPDGAGEDDGPGAY